ncbi:thiamine pyrophosphate-dependent dehydrogenase E1 component subunit alpha [Cryptosporangium sp. NPDC051539]|uniref:thiamine pyrophosphate-dependent dehydrogenase E1 component subunit alpha n=1 Tax=Cryptosporangium sp. NPDC051539 TaxID=3363962 RepID=UPI003796AA54
MGRRTARTPTELLVTTVQLLTPDGERRDDDRYPLGVTPDELRGMYREMLVTRAVDAEATALQRQGELGLWAPSLGQEAAQVASARAFAPDDMLFPSYREHGVALARGVEPAELLALFRGTSHGGWNPFERRLNTYTIVLAAQLLHAVGYAMGVQRDGAEEVVGVYFGDGSTSQGDTMEAMNWAGVTDAPVVFCLQNNQYAISVPVERQSPAPLYRRADGFGFPGVRVDGNDVLAVLAVTRWAVERARAGEGPTLIESFTYRMGPHTTSDDPRRYRDEDELAHWRALDPILRLRRHLDREQLADDSFYAHADSDAAAHAAAIRAACLTLEPTGPFPVYAG